jgi:hypothetical protein
MAKTTGGSNKSDGAAASQRSRELSLFSRAVSLFNAGKFGEAKPLFDELSSTPDATIADAARSRARICEQRTRES